jgi:hypothetical protein
MKFQWIHEHRREFSLQPMRDVLGVSKSGYYASPGRPISRHRQRREHLAGEITRVFDINRGLRRRSCRQDGSGQ